MRQWIQVIQLTITGKKAKANICMFHGLISTYYDLPRIVRRFANAFLMKNVLLGSDASDAVFRRTL